MSPDQLQALNATLDRVPAHILRSALRRKRTDSRIPIRTTPEDHATFRHTLARLAEREHLHPEDIMGTSRLSRLVELRWELYARLDRLGFTIPQISEMTGHDYTRIRHWHTKRRPILKSLRKSKIRNPQSPIRNSK